MSVFSFLKQYSNGNKYCPTNKFQGQGLKHYGCALFSPLVRGRTLFTAEPIDHITLQDVRNTIFKFGKVFE